MGQSRRDFMKLTGLGILGASVASQLLTTEKAFAGAPPMVSESDPQAKALGYHQDAAKVDTKKFPKKAGKEGQIQTCANCQFFLPKAGEKAPKAAGCTIFPGKNVEAKGWCNSWVKKA